MVASLFKTYAIMLFSSLLLVSSVILSTLLLSSETLAPDSQTTLLAQSVLFICLVTTRSRLMNHHHCHCLALMLFSSWHFSHHPRVATGDYLEQMHFKKSTLLFNYTHYNYFKLLLDFLVLCFVYVSYFSHYQVAIL